MDEQEHCLQVELTHRAFMLPPLEDAEPFTGRAPPRVFAEPIDTTEEAEPEITNDMDANDILQWISFESIRKFILEYFFAKKIVVAVTNQASFKDLVDPDDEAFQDHISGSLASKLIESPQFKLTMTILIVLNSVVIAFETSPTYVAAYGPIFKALDSMFISAFTLEILIKWYHNFTGFWKSGWNIFDFVLIFAALVAPAIAFISSGRILRILRILRAFRALRGIESLEGLRLVAKTIIQSLPDMGNILVLLGLVMFIFAVVGVTLFRTASEKWFGDIPEAMFTLFILVTGDGFEDVFRDLSDAGQFGAGAIYFVLFMICGTFVLANMIVAVVVTNLEKSFEMQKKVKNAKYRVLKKNRDHIKSSGLRNVSQLDDDIKSRFYRQLPLEIPDLDVIPEKKLYNYFMVLSLIEENLCEYKNYATELQKLVEEVKSLNMERIMQNEEGMLTGEGAAADDEESEDDDSNGDPLSNLLSR